MTTVYCTRCWKNLGTAAHCSNCQGTTEAIVVEKYVLEQKDKRIAELEAKLLDMTKNLRNNLKNQIMLALMVGPMNELEARIDALIEQLFKELK